MMRKRAATLNFENGEVNMALVVMKFGGTSVANEENRSHAIAHVRAELEKGNQAVVVVSAMGRKGAPYATDTLLSLLNPDVDLLTRDLLVSCGETISACVFAGELAACGIPARPFTAEGAGIRTNDQFASAEIIDMDTANIREALNAGIVPVITGFQGRTASGMTTTIGRGGSDTSAVIIGGYLNADTVDIYTDVNGVAKTDPRIVPYADFMDVVSSEDMLTLASWGAGVIHPKAVSAGVKFGIPMLRVRSTFTEKEGTAIRPGYDGKGLAGVALMKNLQPDEQGDISLNGKCYRQQEGGSMAIVTALCHGASEAQLNALKNQGLEIIVDGNMVQVAVSMEKAAETVKTVYDGLNG